MVGESPKIIYLADQMYSVSRTDLSILVLGETGAGKEIVAKTLHSLSERRGKLICVNCSALPAELAARQPAQAGGSWRFHLRDYDEVDAVLAPLRAAGLHIEEMEVLAPDLEDVFIQVMGQPSGATQVAA